MSAPISELYPKLSPSDVKKVDAAPAGSLHAFATEVSQKELLESAKAWPWAKVFIIDGRRALTRDEVFQLPVPA